MWSERASRTFRVFWYHQMKLHIARREPNSPGRGRYSFARRDYFAKFLYRSRSTRSAGTRTTSSPRILP